VKSEILNLVLFCWCIAKVLFLCGGYIAVPLLLAEIALNLSEKETDEEVNHGH
jgi:hypothetical protein